MCLALALNNYTSGLILIAILYLLLVVLVLLYHLVVKTLKRSI